MKKEKKEIVICYQAPIDELNVGRFLDLLEHKVPDDCEKLILLMNSTGGSIRFAIGLYNLLHSLSCTVVAYNISCVDSAALLMYLGASERYCTSTARFLVHPVYHLIHTEKNLDELSSLVQEMSMDTEVIAEILADNSLQCKEKWLEQMKRRHCLTAQEALSLGLAKEVSCLPSITCSDIFYVKLDTTQQ